MAIEKLLKDTIAAVNELNETIKLMGNVGATPVVEEPVVPETPAAPEPPTPPTPPAPPVPEPPAEVVQDVPAPPPAESVETPFADAKEFMNFVMGSYKRLGPTNGAQIQGVITSMGLTNVNDVPPEKWAEFKQKVEAI